MDTESKGAAKAGLPGEDSRNLTNQIYCDIKREILLGRLPVREKLNVVHLAERYNVSRTPVTQALELLKQDNLVEQLPGRRAVVREPSPQEISTVYLLRRQLEPAVARISLAAIPSGEPELLEERILHLQQHPEMRAESVHLDARLHAMLWRYMNDPLITSVFRTISEYSVRLQSFTTYSIEEVSTNCQEHLAIVRAVLEKDGEKTARALEQHLDSSCRRLLAFCREK